MVVAIIVILFVAYIAFGISFSVIKKKRVKKQEEIFNSLPTLFPGFKADKVYKNGAGLSMIVLDQDMKKVFMTTAKGAMSAEIITRAVNFDDLVKVEIIEDGTMVGSKSASGAVLGGILGGTEGAIIGQNFGKTTYKKKIRNIILKVLLDDIVNPGFEMIFYNKALTKFYPLTKARKECQEWTDVLFVIMKRRSNAPSAPDQASSFTGFASNSF
jgi:hypothetical protein